MTIFNDEYSKILRSLALLIGATAPAPLRRASKRRGLSIQRSTIRPLDRPYSLGSETETRGQLGTNGLSRGNDSPLAESTSILHLKTDVVRTENDIHGSTYLVTRQWVRDQKALCKQYGETVRIGLVDLR